MEKQDTVVTRVVSACAMQCVVSCFLVQTLDNVAAITKKDAIEISADSCFKVQFSPEKNAEFTWWPKCVTTGHMGVKNGSGSISLNYFFQKKREKYFNYINLPGSERIRVHYPAQ